MLGNEMLGSRGAKGPTDEQSSSGDPTSFLSDGVGWLEDGEIK